LKKSMKMRKYINLCLVILGLNLVSCEKFLEPEPDGTLSEEELLFDPSFAEGLLMTAYVALPDDYDFATDVATDDAVTNDKNSVYRRMATGEWLSSFDPISEWSDAYLQISYINQFLGCYESVLWSRDPNLNDSINSLRNSLHMERLKGEAHGLRAWYQIKLLQNHAGKASDGRLLGYPIINSTLGAGDNWELPRNTFAECVANIFTDLDTAIANLPGEWVDGADPFVNETSGARYENRINGNAARALKSRVALLAASPAFSEANAVTWEEAATIAGDLLSDLGALYPNGIVFYKEKKNKEIIWNRAEIQKKNWEEDNFPPSLFGKGRTNPSQNLVDAFPMEKGYPITHPESGYDPDNPYQGRDPRFYEYIIHNQATLKQTPINTFVGASQDGINSLETSTRTGYYLKKLMAEGVKLTPGSSVNAGHTYTLVRMTEVLLNYAEAANEAWGPDGDPNALGFTARDKIVELHRRANLDSEDYLRAITTQEEMREIIHAERRIELCFEGFRFWDIRRWNDQATLTAPVRGVHIILNPADTSFTYNYSDIEERMYTSDMIYGPVPYEETLKYPIEQNTGW
jgi:hypothetical protein